MENEQNGSPSETGHNGDGGFGDFIIDKIREAVRVGEQLTERDMMFEAMRDALDVTTRALECQTRALECQTRALDLLQAHEARADKEGSREGTYKAIVECARLYCEHLDKKAAAERAGAAAAPTASS